MWRAGAAGHRGLSLWLLQQQRRVCSAHLSFPTRVESTRQNQLSPPFAGLGLAVRTAQPHPEGWKVHSNHELAGTALGAGSPILGVCSHRPREQPASGLPSPKPQQAPWHLGSASFPAELPSCRTRLGKPSLAASQGETDGQEMVFWSFLTRFLSSVS